MTSFSADRPAPEVQNPAQRQPTSQRPSAPSHERLLQSEIASAKQEQLIKEFAVELTPTPEELAEAYGRSEETVNESTRSQQASEQALANGNLDVILRIPVSVQVVLGSATMPISGLVKLGRGAVIPLDRRVGEPVDVMVNGRVVARGEVVVMDEAESRFGISLTEVVSGAGSVGAA